MSWDVQSDGCWWIRDRLIFLTFLSWLLTKVGSEEGQGVEKERESDVQSSGERLLPREWPWPQVPGFPEHFFPCITFLDLHLSLWSLRLRKHLLSYSSSSSLKFLNENSHISSLSLFAFDDVFPSPSWFLIKRYLLTMVKAGAWSSGSGQAPWLPKVEKQILRQPWWLVGESRNPKFNLMLPRDFWACRLLGRGLRKAVLWGGKCFWSAERKSRETTVWGILSLMQGVPTTASQRWCSKTGSTENPWTRAREGVFT